MQSDRNPRRPLEEQNVLSETKNTYKSENQFETLHTKVVYFAVLRLKRNSFFSETEEWAEVLDFPPSAKQLRLHGCAS